MSTPLLNAVRSLHVARMTYADRTRALAEAKAVFEMAQADLIRDVADAKAAVTSADAAVRTLAEAVYDASGETKPVMGVTIVTTNTMDYDPDVALTWAKEKQMALIPESLDVAAFGKIAKATPLSFVIYGTTTSVRIASDLAGALMDAEPSDAPEFTAVADSQDDSHGGSTLYRALLMRITPELQQAMRYLKQKAHRAEAARFRYQQEENDDYRRAAEFDAFMLIGAAMDAVREWERAKMPTLGELLEREHQQAAAVAAGA